MTESPTITEGKNSVAPATASRKIVMSMMAMIVFVVSGILLFPQTQHLDLKSDSFSVDEPGWIAASYYYSGLVRLGNFDWDKWNCEECGSGSSYGSLNMHLGEWLMAIPLQVGARSNAKPFAGYYDVDMTLAQNIRAGNVPSTDVLVRARWSSAAFGCLCCVLVFCISGWTYNAAVGLMAAALVALNPVVMKLSGQAMTDTFYNFFLLACCLTFVALYKTVNKRRAVLLISLAGALTGLACSVKVTGFVVGTAIFLIVGGWHFYRRNYGKKELVCSLAAFLLCAFGTVYLLNPLFWPDLRKLDARKIASEVRSLADGVAQSKHLPWSEREAFLADNRYPQVKNLSHVMEFPLLFLRWRNMMDRQAMRGWQGWTGPRLLSLNGTLVELSTPLETVQGGKSASLVGPFAVAIFLCVGVVALVRGRSLTTSSKDDSYLVPLMCFLVNYLFIALFMKLNWDRYYLPTIIAAEMVIAVGFWVVASRVWAFVSPNSLK